MAGEDSHHEKLAWNRGHPIWPREPDIDVVRSLAKRHLATELPVPLENNLLEVSFFTEGGFNKLYKISYDGCRTSYLLRATVPIEPYYKIESEVATIAYLRANTDIPVPRILAWHSNRDNELTFEWILMEKIEGVPLFDVWRKVPWEYKLELTGTIAGMVKQLRDQKFDRIGGLYFSAAAIHIENKAEKIAKPESLGDDLPKDDAAEEAIHKLAVEIVSELVDQVAEEFADKPTMDAVDGRTSDIPPPSADQGLHFDARSKTDTQPLTTNSQCINEECKKELSQLLPYDSVGNDDSPEGRAEPSEGSKKELSNSIVGQAEFAVGRMFDPLFFVGRRPYLPASRGPYKSSLEWLSALVRVQLDWIKVGPIDDDDDYDEELEQKSPMIERLCRGFLNVLPTVCSDEDTSTSCCLHHTDLNEANILIDPETFEITGIVDWEFINVVPQWRALEHPKFLRNIEPMSEDEPPVPVYEDYGEEDDDTAVYLRDRWDDRLLRRHFDQTMDRISQDNGVSTDDAMRIKVKRDCHEVIPALTDFWNWSKMWLKAYKTTGVSKNSDDWSKESVVYGEIDSDAESETWLDEMQS